MSPKALNIFKDFPTDIAYEEAKEKPLLASYVVPETYPLYVISEISSESDDTALVVYLNSDIW